MITALLAVLYSLNLQAATKVTVYENKQSFYQVRPGDTLGEICKDLASSSSLTNSECLQKLVADNPAAFINGDVNRLLAGTRLWLPGSFRPVSKLDPSKYSVQRFSWGTIKTPK